MKKLPLLLFAIFVVTIHSSAQSWSKLGSGATSLNAFAGGIFSLCMDNHHNIFAAGSLTDTNFHVIVSKWDGTSWTRLGFGTGLLDSISNIQKIICDTSGNLYLSGIRENESHGVILKWNGSTWAIINDTGFRGDILTMNFDKFGNLYAAGSFTDTVGDTTRLVCVKKWDGATWTTVGTGTHALHVNGAINTMLIDTTGDIYVAGDFTDSAWYLAGHIAVAKWDGTSWSFIGSGVVAQAPTGYQIFDLKMDISGNFYVGGRLGSHNIYKWDGVSWAPLGIPSDSLVSSNCVFCLNIDKNNNLYAGGAFVAPGTGMNFVAKWDGTTWSELGTGASALNANNWIYSIILDEHDNVYAAGNFRDTSVHIVVDSMIRLNMLYVAKYTNPVYLSTTTLQSNHKIDLYPNPTDGKVNLVVPDNTLLGSAYSIIDYAGRVLNKGVIATSPAVLDFAGQPSGIYLLSIQNKEQQLNYKILKQ